MNDIVERLRVAAPLPTGLYCEAADVIDALRQQLAEEHEAHLIAEQRWIEELAAAQAHIQELRSFVEASTEYAIGNPAFERVCRSSDDSALKAALAAEREKSPLHDAADIATKSMRRAWQLGQTYWQQADSESYKQNAKSAITQDTFNDLLDSTADAIRALENE